MNTCQPYGPPRPGTGIALLYLPALEWLKDGENDSRDKKNKELEAKGEQERTVGMCSNEGYGS
jgi:hypothetical protein